MLTKSNYLEYAKSFVSRITKKGIDLKVAKVYGSFVKNNNNENSDLDVLLVSDHFKGVSFIDFSLISDELIDFHDIHAKTYSTMDYLDGDPFINEINKNSISIIANI